MYTGKYIYLYIAVEVSQLRFNLKKKVTEKRKQKFKAEFKNTFKWTISKRKRFQRQKIEAFTSSLYAKGEILSALIIDQEARKTD